MWGDFALNFISEVIGILLTVFLVDKLIQRREDKRWKTSKDFIYAELFEITETVLTSVTPARKIGTRDRFCYFGSRKVEVCREFPDENIGGNTPKDVLQAILLNEIKLNNTLVTEGAIIQTLQERILRFYDNSAFLLEPEVLSIFLKLKERIEHLFLVQRSLGFPDINVVNEKGNLTQYADTLVSIVVPAYELRSWLERRADKIEKIELTSIGGSI